MGEVQVSVHSIHVNLCRRRRDNAKLLITKSLVFVYSQKQMTLFVEGKVFVLFLIALITIYHFVPFFRRCK